MKKILFVTACIFLLAAGCQKVSITPSPNPEPIACTMEAKLCPDGSAVGRVGPNCEFAACPIVNSLLTEAEARVIAEKTCIKGGESLASGYYNENSKTWWYDANLNATRPGCNPACVVSEETKTAEINWRCTGAIPPAPVQTSGISGYIHTGPSCPVQRIPPDPNCADKPYANISLLAINLAGKQYQGQTNASGNFLMEVPPGTYTIKVNLVNVLPRCEQTQAIVTANNFVSVDVSCDTGIR